MLVTEHAELLFRESGIIPEVCAVFFQNTQMTRFKKG